MLFSIPNPTKYTCPFLMNISLWIYRIKLRKTHIVYWKQESGDNGSWYIRVQPKGRKGGWQASCPFPNWMIRLEYKFRILWNKVAFKLFVSHFFKE